MVRYWIGVACKEHVERGVLGSFAQVCHGKVGPLTQMTEGDWIVYYSPTLDRKESCQCFTAIGQVRGGDPYLVDMGESFNAWRRDVLFVQSKQSPIQRLLDQLSFIPNKQKWGFPFRRGCFEISEHDFQIIAVSMGVECDEKKGRF